MDEWAEAGFNLKSKAKREKCERRWFTFFYLRSYGWLIKGKLKFSWEIDFTFHFLHLVDFIVRCGMTYLTYFSSPFVSFIKLHLLLVHETDIIIWFFVLFCFLKQRLEIVKGRFLTKVGFSQSSRGYFLCLKYSERSVFSLYINKNVFPWRAGKTSRRF